MRLSRALVEVDGWVGTGVGTRVSEEVHPRLAAVCIVWLGRDVGGNCAVGMGSRRRMHIGDMLGGLGAGVGAVQLVGQVG